MPEEKRKHPRFTVSDNAFIALNCQNVLVAKIKDISMGGASFEIIDTDDLEAIQHDTAQTLDIFLFGNGFRLSNIACRIVYQSLPQANPHGTTIFAHVFTNKQCAAEFRNLNQHQGDALNNFLEKHSILMQSVKVKFPN